MLVTEEQAKEMWCPAVRLRVSTTTAPAFNRINVGVEEPPLISKAMMCIGSRCMWFRWADANPPAMRMIVRATGQPAEAGKVYAQDAVVMEPTVTERLGFCGAAGKP